MINYVMHSANNVTEYSLISKLLHWVSAILLFIQIPLGFYLVNLDFGPERIGIENLHVIIGLSIFYLVIKSISLYADQTKVNDKNNN